MEQRGREEQTRQERKQRVPLGVPRRKLEVPQVQGKVMRWVNDHVGRIQQAEAGGYQFVEDPSLQVGDLDASNSTSTGSRVSRVVGKNEDGTPLRAYLMEIDEDWYRQDQEEKQRQIDKTEESLRRGSDQQGQVGKDGRYVPKEGIKIEHSRRKDMNYG